MRYALIEDGIVINVIWLNPYNAAQFPGAVPGEVAAIGDEYRGGRFWRDGQLVKTPDELHAEALMQLADAEAALADLGIVAEEVPDNA